MKKYCTPLVQSFKLNLDENLCLSTQGNLSDWNYNHVYTEEEE